MVIRVEKTKNYTVMSNFHLRDKNLSLKAKGLMSLMLSLPDDWDYSVAGLNAICKDGESAIRSAIKELEDNGYLKRERVYTDGKISDWNYTLYEKPIENKEDSLVVENQQVGFQLVENPAQRNTKQSNTKERKRNTISKDIVSETEPKEKKPNLYQKCLALIEEFTDDEETRSLLDTYLRMRLAMKDKPMYGVNQWKGLINKLKVLEGDVKEIIRYSTERGYASFYVPTQYQSSNRTTRPNRAIFGENEDNKSEKVTKEEIENGYFSGVSF